MRSVGDHCVPTGRQSFCRDQACEGAWLWRPGERVAPLALDLYRYDNGDQKLLGDGGHEQVAHLRLTCREDPLCKLRDSRPWQGLAEGHSCMDELLHIAIDQHDIAASTQCQRGLGLVLEIVEIPLAQRRRGRQRLQSLDLTYDLAIDIRRQSPCFNCQVFPNVAELFIGD